MPRSAYGLIMGARGGMSRVERSVAGSLWRRDCGVPEALGRLDEMRPLEKGDRHVSAPSSLRLSQSPFFLTGVRRVTRH